MNRLDIINHLIRRYGYRSYLEIGVQKGLTIQRVACKLKHGVDPAGSAATHKMTSDAFFAALGAGVQYDIIFIDGLHVDEQARRDIANALDHLSPGGVIVVHDCLPKNKREQEVPRPHQQKDWTGNVWRAFVHYRRRPDLEMYVVNTDHGIGIIRRGGQEPLVVDGPTFGDFVKNQAAWLNLITADEFREREGWHDGL